MNDFGDGNLGKIVFNEDTKMVWEDSYYWKQKMMESFDKGRKEGFQEGYAKGWDDGNEVKYEYNGELDRG